MKHIYPQNLSKHFVGLNIKRSALFFISCIAIQISFAQPVISSFSPLSGAVGANITITGTGFNSTPANNIVYFGGVKASVSSASATSLMVAVPAGASAYQPITITTGGLTAYSSTPFTLTFTGAEAVPNANSIASPVNFTPLAYPDYITMADLDGDGKPDMLGAYINGSSSTGYFSVLRNTGTVANISFGSRTDFGTANAYAVMPVVGDFNGDGKLDVAAVAPDFFTIFTNTSTTGNISFTQNTDITIVNGTSAAAVADFDGDGKPDLIVQNSSFATITVYLNTSNNGIISFAAGVSYSIGSPPGGEAATLAANITLALDDLDGDGKPEIIAAVSSQDFVAILKNTSSPGTVSFNSPVDIPLLKNQNPEAICIADFNGDGKPDMAVNYLNSATVSILQNTTSGGTFSFVRTDNSSAPESIASIATGDINGDGNIDIIATSANSNILNLFINTGTAGSIAFNEYTYTLPIRYMNSIYMCDVDGDGRPDILTASDYTTPRLSVIRNRFGLPDISSFTPITAATDSTVTITGLNFSNVTGVSFGGVPVASYAIVNPTTITAVVGNGASGNVYLSTAIELDSLAGFTYIATPVITSFAPSSASAGTLVTLTGSNFTYATAVYFGGVQALSFTIVNDNTITATVSAGAATGSVSVVSPGGTGSLAGFVLLSTPVITAIAPSSGPVGSAVTITGSGFNPSIAGDTVYFGSVKATVTAATASSITVTVPTGFNWQPVTVTCNSLTTYSPQPFIVTFANSVAFNNAKAFTGPTVFPAGGEPEYVASGDLDGDGLPDVGVAYLEQVTSAPSIFLNKSTNGNISFATGKSLDATQAVMIKFADIDGDGKLDVVTLNYPGTFSVYKNQSVPGSISFATRQDFSGPGYGVNDVEIRDIDGDGKPDIIIAINGASSQIVVYRNTSMNGTISFAPANVVATGANEYLLAVTGDMDGDGKADLAVLTKNATTSAGAVAILRNTSVAGSISFSAETDYPLNASPQSIDIGDLDGDGYADLAIAYFDNSNTQNAVSVLKNTSVLNAISFAAKVDYAAGKYSESVSINDMDGDGKPDLVLATVDYNFLVFKNASSPGSISFLPVVSIATVDNLGANNSGSTADLDGDGKPDVFFANYNPGGLKAIRNRINEPSIVSFSPASAASDSTVTLTGTNFTGVTSVSFNGVPAKSFTVVNSTTITAVVDTLSGPGNIKITYPYSADSISGYTYIPAPTISYFTPTSAVSDDTITIAGTNFNGVTGVYFGGAPAVLFSVGYSSITDSFVITAIVGRGSSGDVTVTAAGGTAVMPGFIYTAQTPPGNTLNFGPGYVTVPTGDISVSGSYTVEAWVQPGGVTGQGMNIFSTRSNGGDHTFDMKITDEVLLTADIGDGTNWLTTSAAVNYNFVNKKWYHVAYTVSPSGYIVYINGDSVGSGNFTGTPLLFNSVHNQIDLGILNPTGYSDIEYLIGNIDELKVWNTVRTTAQVNADMLNVVANPVQNSALVLYYNFDEGTAGGSNRGIYQLIDQGPNNLTGALTDFAYTGTYSNWLESYAMVVPVAMAASNVVGISFTANWQAPAVGIVDSYVLDVAYDSLFSNFVSGYSSKSVTGTSVIVTGLAAGTKYWYRLSATKASVAGQGAYSSAITTTTVALPIITSFTPVYGQQNTQVTIKGSSFTTVSSVSFGGTATSFTIVNDTIITATIGAGSSGFVSITNLAGTANKAGFVYANLLAAPGNALNFSSSSGNNITVPTGNTTVTDSFTVEAWVMPANLSSDNNVFSTRANGGDQTFDMSVSQNTIHADIGTGNNWLTVSANATFTFVAGRWYHIAYSVTPSGYTIYVNGNIVGSGTLSGTPLLFDSVHNVITIGYAGNPAFAAYFNGNIDEIRVWAKALTQAQVQVDMLNTINNPSTTPGLAAYYNFDEGTAGGSNAGITSLLDWSPNNLTGTLNSFGLTGSTGNWVESYAMVVPGATAAANINTTGFTATWTAPNVGIVTNYLLDVATDSGFAHIVSGYSALAVTGTYYAVTGLAQNTQYWYRVRANKTSVAGQGAYSSSIAVTTLVTPVITSFTPQTAFTGDVVVITGNYFMSVTNVSFGGTPAQSFVVVNQTTINATVAGGSSGNVSVTTAGGTATSPNFTYVTVAAAISGSTTTCTNAAPSVITFTGSNGMQPYTFTYTLNGGSNQTITTTTGSSVTVTVPSIAGVYKYTLVSVQDALANTQPQTGSASVTVNQPSASSTPITVCSSQLPYTWNGTQYNISGNYTFTTTNAAGCDSVATLVLTVLQSTSSTTPVSVCAPQLPYVWNGTSYNVSGTYTFTTTNKVGCDSVATLVLTVLQPSSSSQSISICAPQLPYVWNGTSYNTSGTYTFTTTNAVGCDSVATLVLTVLQPSSSTQSASVCASQLPYVWNGTSYNTSGAYTFTTTNAVGCDSVATLVLTVLQPSSSTQSATVCSSQLPYIWNGNAYNTSGNYTFTTVNAVGCDSVASLVLTVVQSTVSTTNLTVCSSQLPYTWNGAAYTLSGTYTFATTNAAGCDSVATLVLTVNQSTSSSTSLILCASQLPYTWNGTQYNTAGTYTFTTTNTSGCDSVATLILNIPYDTSITTIVINPASLPYSWNGNSYSSGGLYIYHTTGSYGCDSVAELRLTITGALPPIGFGYTTPNTFTVGDTIRTLIPKTVTAYTKTVVNNSFSNPAGVVVDGAGNIYVADANNSYITKLTPNGTFIANLGNGLNSPQGIALDGAGNIYVADQGNSAVKKISPDGQTVTTLGSSFGSPVAVAVDLSGNVFVADPRLAAIDKIAASDGSVSIFYTDYSAPSFLTVDLSGNVYVTDYATGTITKISPDGSTITPIGPVTGQNTGLAVDATGNIFVANQNNGFINQITPGGTVSIVAAGFSSPTGVGLDASGNIYVTNINGEIDKISSAGGIASSYTINPSLPSGLKLDPSTGAISGTPALVAAQAAYTVTATNAAGSTVGDPVIITVNVAIPPPPSAFNYITPNLFAKGTAITPLTPTFVTPGTLSNFGPAFSYPVRTTVDANGNVYVGDDGYGNIAKLTPDGHVITSLGAGINQILGIVANSSGDVFVTDGTAVVKKLPANGGPAQPWGSGFTIPYGLAVNAAGNVYVSDVNTGVISKISPDGSTTTVFYATSGYALSSITLDASGNLFGADFSGHIVEISADGTSETPVATIAGSPNIASIAVDAAGNVYVADRANNVIDEISAGGAITTVGTGFLQPQGVAIDASGNIYVADSGNGLVKKIAGNGGPVTGYIISPALPGGLAIDGTTGIISGTPATASPITTYTVTATGPGGNTTSQLVIKVQNSTSYFVIPPAPFSYTTPNVFVKGNPISALAPNVAPAGTVTNVGSGYSYPTSIATDAMGNVYVADAGNGVQEIQANGAGQVQLGTGFSGNPLGGLVVDGSGNIYVSDPGNVNVIKIAPGGVQTVMGTGFINPQGLAVDGAGYIYVADPGNHNVTRVSPDGLSQTVVFTGTYNGTIPTNYYPEALAIDSLGSLYIGDETGIITKITTLNAVSIIGIIPGQVSGIAFDANGNVFTSDSQNGAIRKLTPGGVLTTVDSILQSAGGIALDSAGNIYTSDSYNAAVKKISGPGGTVSAYSINPALPAGLTLNTGTGIISGTPAMANPQTAYTVTAANTRGSANASLVITITNTSVTNGSGQSFTYNSPNVFAVNNPISALSPVFSPQINPAGTITTIGSGYNQPLGVAVDGVGNVYVGDTYNNQVEKVSADGTVITILGSGFSGPQGLSVDAAGNVFVADGFNSLIKKISPDGSTITILAPSYAFSYPGGVAVDAADNVYVADYGNNAIEKIASDGVTVTTLAPGFSFNGPDGVAVDAAGNVYVADYGNNAVEKIAPDGVTVTVLGAGFNEPNGVAVDAAGNVFVASQGDNSVRQIAPDGITVTSVGSGFNQPGGVAVDLADNIYVADFGNNAIKKIQGALGAVTKYMVGTTLPSGLGIDSVTGIISGNPSAISAAADYTVTAVRGAGNLTTKVNIAVVGCLPGSWTGAVDSNWNNAANWCTGLVPTAADNVIINAGTPHNPVISNSTSGDSVNNITIAADATLTIINGDTLSVLGNITNSDTIYANAGSINIVGSANQTISGVNYTNNLIINNSNGVTITGGTTTVLGIYTPIAGTLHADGYLVLASTPTGTASVAPGTGNYSSGNVIVQRYIPAHRAWRFLTAPVTTGASIFNTWQNSGVATDSTGVEIWSPNGNVSSNGMIKGGGAPSAEYFDPTVNNGNGGNWVGLTSTYTTQLNSSTAATFNNAFGVFVTGPYGSGNITPSSGAAATTLSATGTLQTGEQQFAYNNVPAGNYILVGNPYASPVDFTHVGATGATSGNINNIMWAWDAQRSGTSYGGYVTFSWDASTGSYDQDIDPAQTAQTDTIQSGQAIFVQADTTTHTNGTLENVAITFDEADKAIGKNTNQVFGITLPSSQVRIALNRQDNSSMEAVDGVLVKYGSNYKAGVSDDASKLYNYDENLALRIGNNYLAIERKPLPTLTDTLFLDIYALKKNTNYSFSINPSNINLGEGIQPYLVDNYLNTKTPISFASANTVAFNTTAVAGSYSETRFIIVFSQTQALASTITNVKAWAKDKGVQVQWTVATEQGIKQYIVEKSADGITFTATDTTAAIDNNQTQVYGWFDANPYNGNNYYRIKVINKDGSSYYSNVVMVNINIPMIFKAYPNPLPRGEQLKVEISGMPVGKYTLQIFSNDGKQVMQNILTSDGNTSTELVNLPALAAGVYQVILFDGTGKTWKQKLLVD